jgi:hypothetical protein
MDPAKDEAEEDEDDVPDNGHHDVEDVTRPSLGGVDDGDRKGVTH